MLNVFSCAICHPLTFFGELSDQTPFQLPVVFKKVVFLISGFWEFGTYSRYKSFIRYVICKHLLLFSELSSHFLDNSWSTKVLKFFMNPIYFFFACWSRQIYLWIYYSQYIVKHIIHNGWKVEKQFKCLTRRWMGKQDVVYTHTHRNVI